MPALVRQTEVRPPSVPQFDFTTFCNAANIIKLKKTVTGDRPVVFEPK